MANSRWSYALAVLIALCLAHGSAAQNYPSKPIASLSVFRPARGRSDRARGRTGITDGLGRRSSSITAGRERCDRCGARSESAADGSTIGLVSISSMVLNVHMLANPAYHTLRDFTPISTVGLVPFAITVHPGVPARSLKERLRSRGLHRGKSPSARPAWAASSISP